MGCIKLDILEKSFVPMKVVYRNFDVEQKSVQRFLRVDPLASEYPHNSPYAFSENRVLDGVELEGLEFKPIHNSEGDMVDAEYVGYDWSSGSPVAPEGTINNFSIGGTRYSSGAGLGLYNPSTGQGTGNFEMWSITTTAGNLTSSIGSSGNISYSSTSTASGLYGVSETETVTGTASYVGEKTRRGMTKALYSYEGVKFQVEVDRASKERAQQMAAYRSYNMTGIAQPIYPELMLIGGFGSAGGRFATSFILGTTVDALSQFGVSGNIGSVDWIGSLSSGLTSGITKRPFLTIPTASLINGAFDFTFNDGFSSIFDSSKDFGSGLIDAGFSFGGNFAGSRASRMGIPSYIGGTLTTATTSTFSTGFKGALKLGN